MILLAAVSLGGLEAAGHTLSINTTSTSPLSTAAHDGYHDLITIEAFRRIGHQVEIHFLPGERSLINLNDGIDDGTMVRIGGLQKLYSNFRVVPEKIMDWQFVAFTTDPKIKISDWGDLKPYSVTFVNGWKIFEANVTDARQITKVRNADQLFGLLANRRTDVALYEKWSGLRIVRDRRLESIRATQMSLAVREMFMYLHERHQKLVPKLAAALREMKRDGTYDRIFDQTLRKFIGE